MNVCFFVAALFFIVAKKTGPYRDARIQSAYKISQGLLSGEIKKEDVLSENKWFLLNNSYLDKYALVYHFEHDAEKWKCAIGPMHPSYGPGIVFDSEGNLEIYKEAEFIETKPYLNLTEEKTKIE